MYSSEIERYWQNYIETQQVEPDQPYLVDQFGDSPELAAELCQLVLSGIKTATCSAVWEWEAQQTPFPKPGLKTIVLDGQKQPLCIASSAQVRERAIALILSLFC